MAVYASLFADVLGQDIALGPFACLRFDVARVLRQ